MSIIKLFRTNVKVSEIKNLKRSMIIENIHRGRAIAAVMLSIEIFMLCVNLTAAALRVDNRFQFRTYTVMYALMILLNVFFLVYIRSIKSFEDVSAGGLKRMETALVLYVTLTMCWGSIVSMIDQPLYGHLMVFMVNMITCSVVFYLSNILIAIPYACSVAVLCIGLPFFQNNQDVLIGHYVNIFIFVVVSWVASRIVYAKYCSEYSSRMMLQKTNSLLARQIELNDITNLKLEEANLQLKKLSFIDELTGVLNRRGFNNYIEQMFEQGGEKKLRLSMIIMDIDYFKQYNDNYGHSQGDKVLIDVAATIDRAVRTNKAFVTRWGGEEFIYTAFGKEEHEIDDIARSIQEQIAAQKIIHAYSGEGVISLSMGICSIENSSRGDVERCINLADKALYLAKTSGRNCIRKYQDEVAAT